MWERSLIQRWQQQQQHICPFPPSPLYSKLPGSCKSDGCKLQWWWWWWWWGGGGKPRDLHMGIPALDEEILIQQHCP